MIQQNPKPTEQTVSILIVLGVFVLVGLLGFYLLGSPKDFNSPARQVALAAVLAGLLGVLLWNITLQRKLSSQNVLIEANQSQFTGLISSVSDLFFTLDRELRHTAVHGSWVQQAGLTPEFFLGRTALEIMGAEAGAVHQAAGLRALAGEPVLYEWFAEAPAGRRYFQTNLSPIYQNNSEVVGLVGVGREITAFKHTEFALRESEDRFRSVVEQSADGIVIVNEEGLVIEFNLANERISNLNRSAVLGQYLWDVQLKMMQPQAQTPEMLGRIKTAVLSALQTGESSLFDRVIDATRIHADGTAVVVEQRIFPIKTAMGCRMGSIVRDVTAHKKIEKELRESEAHLLAMIKAIPDLMFIIDRSGTYLDFHANDPDLLIAPPEMFIGKSIYDFIPLGEMGHQLKAFNAAFETGNPQIFDYSLDVPAGVKHFEARLASMDEDRILIIIRDVTEQKHQQALLIASLQEKEVLLKEIHHRVKNNMQIMVSLLSLQADQVLDSQAREVFRDSQERIHAMALVHEKLYQSANLAQINFSEYLHDLTVRLAEIFQRYPSVMVRVDAEPLDLGIDTAIPCGLIVNELVSNALKYAYPNGTEGEVFVAFHKKDQLTASSDTAVYQLVVRDHGVGLPADFDPAQTATLGLQLVHILTSQLRGTLTIVRDQGLAYEIEFCEKKVYQR